MNQVEAMRETLRQAQRVDADRNGGVTTSEASCHEVTYLGCSDDPTSLMHLVSMSARMMEGGMSDAKLGRWLGYAQGVLVTRGLLTLEECKEINRSFA